MGLISATGFAVALSVFLGGLVAPFMPLVAMYLFFVTVAATYFGLRYPSYLYPLFIVNISAILASCLGPTLHQNLELMLFIVSATILAVLFQLIYIPGFVRYEVRSWTKESLRNLKLVSQEIFACFLRPEYADNIYLFERRLHVRKTRYMRSIRKLREAAHISKIKTPIKKIDELYDILMDCAQLRRRVSDHTVFALCANELSAISVEISKLFTEMIASRTNEKSSIDTIPLAEKIKLFEDNYQNVLRVTAREPLAFLLFIASLKIFREKVGLYE